MAVGVTLWWSDSTSNKARVTDLVEQTYVLAGFGDQPSPKLLGYGRDSFETGCAGVDSDRFIGGRAAIRVDPAVDWLGGAERLAGALEAEGWDVARWWWFDPATERDERWVEAALGDDRVQLIANSNSIDLVATSGRCNPTIERISPGGDFQPVTSFDQ